jgi:hypothetical protein
MLLGGATAFAAQHASAEAGPRRPPALLRAALPGGMADGLVARWMRVADRFASDPQATDWPRANTIAVVAMAMHDALNAVEPHYRRWKPRGRSEPHGLDAASPILAMSMAAFTVLEGRNANPDLFAEARDLFSAVMAAEDSEAARSAGAALGRAVAIALLDDAGPRPEKRNFIVSDAQGRWRPTPPLMMNSFIYLDRPFLFPNRHVLLGPPPPDLGSARYRTDVEEAWRMGGAGRTERSEAQTEAARFWVPQSLQRNVMQVLLRRIGERPLPGGIWDEARMVSILAVAYADTDVAVYAEKFHYSFWRPVTALNLGNSGVRTDPGWQALLPTPAHPDYPSGHSADLATGTTVIAGLLGEAPVRYQVLDRVGQPVREFPSLAAMLEECSESRIWAGAHFRTAAQEGLRIGRTIAARALEQVPPARWR